MPKSRVNRIIKNISLSVLTLFLIGIGFFALYLRTQYVVPILMYHRVNNGYAKTDVLTITKETFDRQMDFLYKHKYNVISLDKFVDLIKSKGRFPRNTVVITFDDGWKDNYTVAFPILKKYNIPATIFVMVAAIDKDPGILSSADMKTMIDSGFVEIGSHTLSHACLNKMTSMEGIKKEILDSKKLLENHLNREIKFISYPVGGFSPLVRKVTIESGYKAAVSVNPGEKYPDDDIYGLKRLRISQSSNNLFVFWFEISGYYTWFKENRGGHKGKGSYIDCQMVN